MREIRRLAKPFFASHAKRITLFVLLLPANSLLSLWIPSLIRNVLQHHLAETLMADDALLLLLAVSLSAGSGFASSVIAQQLGFRLRNTLRSGFFSRLMHLPLTWHRRERTGELMSRVMEDIGRLQPVFHTVLGPLVLHALIFIGCIVLLLRIDVLAGVVTLGSLLLPLPLLAALGRSVLQSFHDATAAHARANATLDESLSAVRELQLFAREAHATAVYEGEHERAYRYEIRAANKQALAQHAVLLMLGAVAAGLFIFFPKSIQNDVGTTVAFFFYAYILIYSTIALGKVYLAYKGIFGALMRIESVLAESSATHRGSERLIIAHGKYDLRSVAFLYEHRSAVRALSLIIDHGEVVVITGPSGVGKTTVSLLLAGLLKPSEGNVLLDGHEVSTIHWEDRARLIGYLPQDPVLFRATIEENILLGRPRERLSHVLDVSCASEFIDGLPDGLHTMIGERGHTLSSGQRSRIALARALLLDPPVVVLDEPTSTLQGELEKQIWRNLLLERAGKTTIIFSHHYDHIPSGYRLMELSPELGMVPCD